MLHQFIQAGRIALQQRTHRLTTLPVVILYLNDVCNSRCLTCAIWENNEKLQDPALRQMSPALIEAVYLELRRVGAGEVLLSGGEPTMHPDFRNVVMRLRRMSVTVNVVTNGLTLGRFSTSDLSGVSAFFISFDAPDAPSYELIRGVDGFQKMADGVSFLRSLSPAPRVVARCTLQRENVRMLPQLVESARRLGFDTISFLAVDTGTEAFGRKSEGHAVVTERITPRGEDLKGMLKGIEELDRNGGGRFVESGVGKLQSLHRYFLAKLGKGEFPQVKCNAPWISMVIETSGQIRPCFFHEVIGDLSDFNSEKGIGFRRSLNVETNPICRQCVCSKSLGLRGILGLSS